MPLSQAIHSFMGGLRSFLADDASVCLSLDVQAEQEPQVAKLVDAVCAEHDDLVIPLEHAWDGAHGLCVALAAELALSVEQAKQAFGEAERPRFAFPGAMLEPSAQTSIEVRLLEYAESIQRALSNHVRRLVFVLALRVEPSQREDARVALLHLLQNTGTADVKWILFAGAGLVDDPVVSRLRRGPHVFDPKRVELGLAQLALDSSRRVSTLCKDRAALRALAAATEHNVVPATSFVAVVVEGISYGNRMFFFTEAARRLSRLCAEIERTTSGGKHVAPLVEEAHAWVGYPEAEVHFAEFCERLTKAMLKDHGGLLVILAPSEASPADGLAESIDVLSRSAASARVRYLVVDSRLPFRLDEPDVWRVTQLAYVVGPDQIEQGMKARLAAPDCSLIERLRYTSALSAMALGKDDPETALQHALAVLNLAEQAEAPQEMTGAWYGLGNTLYQCGAFEPAEQAYSECVDRALDQGSAALAAQALAGLGHTHFMRQQSEQAVTAYTTAGALWRKLGLTHGEIYALTWHAEAEAQKQRYPEAAGLFEQALARCAAVDPSQADAYRGVMAELLQRKANVHAKAKESQQEKECRAEAAKLGATAPVCDHP